MKEKRTGTTTASTLSAMMTFLKSRTPPLPVLALSIFLDFRCSPFVEMTAFCVLILLVELGASDSLVFKTMRLGALWR